MTREGKGMSSRPDASAVESAVMAGAEPDFPALVRALRDLADSFHHGVAAAVFLVDVGDDGAFRYAGLNRFHEHSTGLTSAQIRGKSPRDLVPDVLTEAHADAVTANYRRCVEARCPIEYEEHLALAGRATWWVTRLVPLFDASGRVARIVGTAWDITVQKRLELDADARQRRFRAVFELSVEAKFLADNEGRYVDVNSATERLLGYTRVELLGMSVWDLLPHPDAEAGRVQWKEFLRSGQLSGEARLRRKDGTLVPVEFEAVANVLDGIHLSVCRDLTARKASEQAAEFARRQLEEAHARLNGMMEALPHPVAAFEADGRIVACNTAYSREVERLYGRTVRPGDSVVEAASHCPQDVDRVVALLARVFDGEQLSVLAEFGDPALGRKLYQIELSPILGGAGKVAGAAFLAYDVTDRARAETALRESEARFRDMAANLPGVVYQWFERADGNRGFRWVSPRLKEIFAVEPQQMDRVADLIHPEDRDRWLASIVEANRDGGIWIFEGRLLYPDGAVKWWQGISRQSQVTDEEIVYNGVMLDISDRKAAEDELRLAAKVFEHSREGIVILAADRTVLSVNRAFTTITGHVPEDVLGGPLAALDVLRGDARQGAVWERVRTAGAWEGEQLLERRNGEVFPARVQLLALRSDGGTSRHFVVILEDISERKAQEERIRHMAQHDFLTGLPNRALLEDRLRQAMPLAVRQGGASRGDVPRPGPLQDDQRLARAPGRRHPAPGGRAQTQQLRSDGGHGEPAGRRRVRRAGAGPGRARRRRGRGTQNPRRRRRALCGRRNAALGDAVDRHQRVSRRRSRHRDTAPECGRRHVPREGSRPEQLPVLHPGDERQGARAGGHGDPSAPGAAEGERFCVALPAAHRSPYGRSGGHGGPAALARPRPR
jgi:PAS domain S-box-containing protein